MPAEIADKVDISGDQPESTAAGAGLRQAAAIQRAQEHAAAPPHEDSRPPAAPAAPKEKPAEAKGSSLPLLGGLGELAGAATQGLQHAQQTQAPLRGLEKNPFLPLSVGAHLFDSAYSQAAFTAQAAKAFGVLINPDMISESAKNVWERQDAVGQAFRGLYKSFATSPIGAPFDISARALTGASQEQIATGGLGQALSLTGNPLNVVMPEGHGAQLVAMIGLPLAQSLWASGDGMEFFKQLAHLDLRDPQSYLNLLWAGSTAMMLRGHIPGAQSAVMRKLLGKEWDQTAELLKNARDQHNTAMRDAVGHSPAPLEEWRQRLLENQPAPGGPRLIVRGRSAAQAGREQALSARQLPSGEIAVSPTEEAKAAQQRRQSILKSMGFTSKEDLQLAAGADGLDQRQAKLLKDHWQELGYDYPLVHEGSPDRPLVHPMESLNKVESEQPDRLRQAVHLDNLERAYGGVMRQGLFFTNDVARSAFRSLLGLARTKDVVHEMYWDAVHQAVSGLNVDGRDLTRAMEGDREVYDKLPAVARQVVDSTRRLNALYQTLAKDAGYRSDFLGNFFWRRPARQGGLRRMVGQRGGAGGRPPVASEKFSHRSSKAVADPETGQLKLVPAYDTVAETNAAIKEQRDYYVQRLSDPALKPQAIEDLLGEMQDEPMDSEVPWEGEGKKLTPLPTSMQTDPEVQQIRAMALTDPAAAKQLAQRWVNRRFPSMNEDFFQVAPSAMRRQIGALHTNQAVDLLLKSQSTFHDADTGETRISTTAVRPTDARQSQDLLNAGYRGVDMGARYQGILFHPDFADALSKALKEGPSLRQKALYRGLMNLERKAIKSIMFIPMAHGMNVAGRFGTYWMLHPLDTARWLTAGKDAPFSLPLKRAGSALHDAEHPDHERDALAYRMEAWMAGVVTPDKSSNWGYEFSKTHAGAIGDGDFIDASATQDLTDTPADVKRSANGLAQAGGKAVSFYNHAQQKFWSWVNDFGVMVYHLDKERLQSQGWAESEAKLYAMRRANTWMGHVAPEDWNPVVHDISRAVMFAPNWWRTLFEMFVPAYGDMGMQWTPAMKRYIAGQEMKTAAAAIGFQKLTGNALNLLTSGHLQSENQDGAKDKIEMTAPWTDHLPWTQGVARQDPKTGGVRTLENPLTRQQLDLERALGYQSGHPGGPSKQTGPLQISAPSDWQSAFGGALLTGVARLAPIFEAGAGVLGNIDLYSTVRDGTPRHLDPSSITPNPYSALLGMLAMVPGGNELRYQLEQGNKEFAKGKSWGTVVSDTIQKMIGTEPQQIMSGWFTGVNPAYTYAPKSEGTAPSDAAYADASQTKQQWQDWLGSSQTSVLSGQTSLKDWLTQYHGNVATYEAMMNAYYKNDPSYANGQDGLVSRWEGLYDQARAQPGDPFSEIDYGKLGQLQAQFKAGLSSDQQQLLQQGLAHNQQQYRILRLYHDTIAAYQKVQELWAQDNNVSASALHQEIADYGKLYGQRTASAAYLREHRDLASWERFKDGSFYKSPLGMLYGLFYGSTRVTNATRNLAQTQEQEIQWGEQALFPEEQALGTGG